MKPRRLVVLGDSLAFTDAQGPKLPGDAGVYPTMVRDLLANATREPWEVTVIARPGADVRETWRTVHKDRHVQFDVLAGADAVIVAIGSSDHAPMGVPPAIEAIVPFLRPARLRRAARTWLRKAYPVIASRTTTRTRTPASEFARLFDQLLVMVRGLTQGASGVVLGPTSHRSRYYGGEEGRHPMLVAREHAQFEIAERQGFATVPCWPLVEPFAKELNVDGIHWPRSAHAAVAGAIAGLLLEQLQGTRPRPPWHDGILKPE